ncbi:MAG: cobalamin-dependent protein [Desulfatibacillum sp.]|nr:cobalamin-dependent protein [Desulfatibacillum sp.]
MILFVHPDSKMMLRPILPMSLPAVINRIEEPVSGRYHDEWTKKEVAGVDIIVMDIHWFSAIKSAIKLSHRFKAINPEAKVIAGGVSASVFRHQILRDSKIDYIIRGDGDIPLAALIKALRDGSDLRQAPNLVAREWESEKTYVLTREDFDQNNYQDISFFPSLKRDLDRLHKQSHHRAYPTYPYLMAARGCSLHCEHCYGAPKNQKRIFNRNLVMRSPEKVKADISAWSENPEIAYMSTFIDFVGPMPLDYSKAVLDRKYNLFVAWDIVTLPSEEALSLLMQSFSGGLVQFSIDQKHASSTELQIQDRLISCIKQVQATTKYDVRVCYAQRLISSSPQYGEALQSVQKATGCTLSRADTWWYTDLDPGPDGACTEAQYQQSLRDTNRHTLWNAAYRIGISLHGWFPKLAERCANMVISNVGDSFAA